MTDTEFKIAENNNNHNTPTTTTDLETNICIASESPNTAQNNISFQKSLHLFTDDAQKQNPIQQKNNNDGNNDIGGLNLTLQKCCSSKKKNMKNGMKEEEVCQKDDKKEITKLLETVGIKSVVMDFQFAPIKWMIDKERGSLKDGGILAYPMGLGKTFMSIAYAFAASFVMKSSMPTLIVCPKSLLEYWKEEIKKHSNLSEYQVAIYHGPLRKHYELRRLKSLKFIVTTYDIVRNEYIQEKLEKKKLYRIKFARIFLDEAHRIRTFHSQQTQAVMHLNSAYRWCITGTPFNNRVGDLISLCQFINVDPYNRLGWWQSHDVVSKQQWRNNYLMISEKPSWMPPVYKHDEIVRMDEKHARFYDIIASMANRHYQAWCDSSAVQKRRLFNGLLVWLLRLRQTAIHPLLMLHTYEKRKMVSSSSPSSSSSSPPSSSVYKRNLAASLDLTVMAEAARENKKKKKKIENEDGDKTEAPQEHKKNGNTANDCLYKPLAQAHAVVTITKEANVSPTTQTKNNQNYRTVHKYKYDNADSNDASIEEYIPVENECDFLNDANPFDIPALCKFWKEGYTPTAKMKALLKLVDKSLKDDPTTKLVIFSQWTSVLDFIQQTLETCVKYKFVRFDGSIASAEERHGLVKMFRSDPSLRIFISTTQAGGVGINLEMAQTVIMFDAWFNPFAEDQAVDRVHRVTQKRDVNVYHLRVLNTVEKDVLKIQLNKRKLAKEQLGLLDNSKGLTNINDREISMNTLSKEEVRSIFRKRDSSAVATIVAVKQQQQHKNNNNNNNREDTCIIINTAKKRNRDISHDDAGDGKNNDNNNKNVSKIIQNPKEFMDYLGLRVLNPCVNKKVRYLK